jgi:hypothetical protein
MYTNMLSANYGVERLGVFQMPIRSRMISYTPDGLTRTAVQPASLQMYSGECRAMCIARLCSTHHSRYTAVRTVLRGLCAGFGLTFYNNDYTSGWGPDLFET